jgi:hypothetical protein
MSTHTTEGTPLLCMDDPTRLFADLLYPRYSPKTLHIHSLWRTLKATAILRELPPHFE